MSNSTNDRYPWFPLEVAALQFEFRQAGLTHTQRCIAYDLLFLLWQLGGTVPDDGRLLKMLEVNPRTWERNRDSVLACFNLRDGVIRHPMVIEQLAWVAKNRQSQSAKANQRWDKQGDKWRSNDGQMTAKWHQQSAESGHSGYAAAMPIKPKQIIEEEGGFARSLANGEHREALVPTSTGGANGTGREGLAEGVSANFDVEAELAPMEQAVKPVPRRDADRRAELRQQANDAAAHQANALKARLQNELASDEMKESLNRLAATTDAMRRG